ncbi:glutathione S-transferase family protein [Aliidiomarina celeris]|uniref:glutathione S-transferase family protein n=1 Tax=Aliidiomarina celeris TaxID=2249428 RepID=UPI000DEBCEB1|nr:glutathione S-transferase family protein [Aliidiomarina celeris]
MKLYGSYTSPFVRHCRVALDECGEQYQFVETDYSQSAAGSPAKRVPFLTIGELKLHDSSSILKYIREHSGSEFMTDLVDFDRYCLINTALDTCINVFLLERDGFTVEQIPYLERQQSRIHAILSELNAINWGTTPRWNDVTIRLACFLDWALFRERLDLSEYSNLLAVLEFAHTQPVFSATAPPKS